MNRAHLAAALAGLFGPDFPSEPAGYRPPRRTQSPAEAAEAQAWADLKRRRRQARNRRLNARHILALADEIETIGKEIQDDR